MYLVKKDWFIYIFCTERRVSIDQFLSLLPYKKKEFLRNLPKTLKIDSTVINGFGENIISYYGTDDGMGKDQVLGYQSIFCWTDDQFITIYMSKKKYVPEDREEFKNILKTFRLEKNSI